MRRSLTRYLEDDRQIFVGVYRSFTRLEPGATVVVIETQFEDGHTFGTGNFLNIDASMMNYAFIEDLREALKLVPKAGRAVYLAEAHGDGRRDHFFLSKNQEGLIEVAEQVASGRPFRLAFKVKTLLELAPLLLPLELQHAYGVAPEHLVPHRVQFGFSGARTDLDVLRATLERSGFKFESVDPINGLKMSKVIARDSAASRRCWGTS